ncbi:MAG TPA: MFS transporter [Candidatus Acidoferrales bacterium]|nr:MFS transporter [Candidatus Acidoferrales bacterium]
MSFRQRLKEIRGGFRPAFWVANATELFERLAFYGQQAVLAIFFHESLRLSVQDTGALMGDFGFAVYLLPVFAGALADRFGFRRSLAFAYLIASIGYFLLGSLSAGWMAPVRQSVPLYWLIFMILMVTALGPSLVKPCVVGTIATASDETVRSLGYSIYYMLVNIGGAVGPIVAFLVRRAIGVENVFRVSALSVFLMCIATLLFYREPPSASAVRPAVPSVGQAIRNMFVVLGNFRFVLFLLIFSGFWVMFYEFFVAMPLYIRSYVDPNADVDLILSVDALTIIFFQVTVSYLTRKIRAFPAMILGTLIATLSMPIVSAYPSTWLVVIALVVFSLGEMTQAPRYYEYVSRLAPPGQQGVFMGFAFLPIAVGYKIAGWLGGYLVHRYGEELHRPRQMWWVLAAIGFATTLLMWVYNRAVQPGNQKNEEAP